jgi:hypothetical protein
VSEPRDQSAQEPDAAPDAALEQLLVSQRPVPGAGFRGDLGRMVAAADPGYGHRPARLRLAVAGWVGGGLLVAGLGALQALGAL